MTPKTAFMAFKWLMSAARIQTPQQREVLIVEDNANDAEQMQRMVQNLGFVPIVRRTLNTALMELHSRDWRRVLVDLRLGPGIKVGDLIVSEGVVFASEAVKANPKVNIVFVTGHASDMDDTLPDGTPNSMEFAAVVKQFPCIVKGVDASKFDAAIAAVLKNGDQAAELKLWRLFWVVTALLVITAVIAYTAGHNNWITP